VPFDASLTRKLLRVRLVPLGLGFHMDSSTPHEQWKAQ
ncbi:hypothetical protein Tco_0470789, partial [Tanacetum coccineum]